MILRILLSVLAILASAFGARAADFDIDALADVRLVVPSEDQSWMDGGLGKLRFVNDRGRVEGKVAGIFADIRAQITPALLAAASVRYEPEQRSLADLTEAYIRYRPVSVTPWQGSVKLGVFFPPISLENDEIGWQSHWTLTPSAINSWVGEELRTLGGEAKISWRGSGRDVALMAALFGWNDPAGILLAFRGWSFNDRPTGLFDRLRLPDALAQLWGAPTPLRTQTFKEIDGRAGWYAGISWQQDGLGRIQILRYDNRGEPTAFREQFAWLTEFWSAGLEIPLGDAVLLGQFMAGKTDVKAGPYFDSSTKFQAGYVLAGWTIGKWRLAARFDLFRTFEYHPPHEEEEEEEEDEYYPLIPEYSERGHAVTLAVSYLPMSWLRLTAEGLRVDSYRFQRSLTLLPPRAVESQFQLSARLYY